MILGRGEAELPVISSSEDSSLIRWFSGRGKRSHARLSSHTTRIIHLGELATSHTSDLFDLLLERNLIIKCRVCAETLDEGVVGGRTRGEDFVTAEFGDLYAELADSTCGAEDDNPF